MRTAVVLLTAGVLASCRPAPPPPPPAPPAPTTRSAPVITPPAPRPVDPSEATTAPAPVADVDPIDPASVPGIWRLRSSIGGFVQTWQGPIVQDGDDLRFAGITVIVTREGFGEPQPGKSTVEIRGNLNAVNDFVGDASMGFPGRAPQRGRASIRLSYDADGRLVGAGDIWFDASQAQSPLTAERIADLGNGE